MSATGRGEADVPSGAWGGWLLQPDERTLPLIHNLPEGLRALSFRHPRRLEKATKERIYETLIPVSGLRC